MLKPHYLLGEAQPDSVLESGVRPGGRNWRLESRQHRSRSRGRKSALRRSRNASRTGV